MKTVKTLLLGTAAGFAAIAGAQAADLPGKATPAEYVRICDTYGAGFFFIPGTDTCLRIGGAVQVNYQANTTPGDVTSRGVGFVPASYNLNGVRTAIPATGVIPAGGVATPGTPVGLRPGVRTLGTSTFDQITSTAVIALLTLDARSATEYGMLRSFIQARFQRGGFTGANSSQGLVNSGVSQSPNASALFLDRAFIQFAGFTFGQAASFFNFYQGDVQLTGNLAATSRALPLLAYTASFGQGFSATVSVENGYLRRYGNQDIYADGNNSATPVSAQGAVPVVAGNAGSLILPTYARPHSGVYGLTYAGQQVPDIVANLRVDQGWGSAQIMGALHQLRDYGNAGTNPAVAPNGTVLAGANFTNVQGGTTFPTAPISGTDLRARGVDVGAPSVRASDKFGFAVGAGLRLNLDMMARGNQFWVQYVYSDGALDYAFQTAAQGGDRQTISGAGNLAGVNALNTQLRDAVVSGNRILTTKAWSVAAGFRHFWTPALRSSLFGSYSFIDQPLASTLTDVRYWTLGANTIWSPVRNLDLGLEVVYHNINARCNGVASLATCPGGRNGPVNINGIDKRNEAAWVGTLRVQRNF